MRANYVSDTVCKGCLNLFTGLDYQTDLFATKNHFMPCNQPHLPVVLYTANASFLACKSLVNVLQLPQNTCNHSLVSCKLGFIPQLSLKHDHCCEANLPSLYDQSVSIITQVTSSWHLHGVWLSTLNSGCQQVAVACSAANCQCMQRSITPNPKISGNKVIQVEASINVKGQLYGYFSITQYLSIHSQPHPFDTAWALDSKRLCFTG